METETREVTEQDVEQKPDEQDAPTPEAPEAPAPEQPKPDAEPAAQEPEKAAADELAEALKPEPKPKAKPRKKAKAKAGEKQTRPKQKPAPKPDTKEKDKTKREAEKAKQEQRDLKARYTELNEQQAKDGSTAGMERAMRNTCEKLGRNVPKWAQLRGQGEPKQKREVNKEDLRLAHRMNALVFGGTIDKEGRYVAPDKPTKFGAPYVTTHVEKIREAMKGKDILKVLQISQAKLKEFAVTSPQEGQKVELEEDTRKAIREFMKANFKPIDKIWARKFAGGAVVLLEDKAKAKRRSKAAAKKRSTPTATSA